MCGPQSIEGDRELGLKSIPVEFGIDTAKWITVGTIDGFQILVALWLHFVKHEDPYAIALTLLIIPQIVAQVRFFLPDPVENVRQKRVRLTPATVARARARACSWPAHRRERRVRALC